jgi:hypothetical protein
MPNMIYGACSYRSRKHASVIKKIGSMLINEKRACYYNVGIGSLMIKEQEAC